MYLKWVGGKSQLAKKLICKFPKKIEKYIEPFAGSASMFFCYHPGFTDEEMCFQLDTPNLPEVMLYDLNPHLINCHKIVRDKVDDLISKLKTLEEEHNSKKTIEDATEYYVSIRDMVTEPITNLNSIDLASYFVYINKTCFNGIWRVNRKGTNNVPFNQKLKIGFDTKSIYLASRMLSKCHIEHSSFEKLDIRKSDKETFVYMDPPYYPISKTSNFTSYNSNKVNDMTLLQSLKSFCKKLDIEGIKWMMSNNLTEEVVEEFKDWKIEKIQAHRFVKALKNNENREKIEEVVIRNY